MALILNKKALADALDLEVHTIGTWIDWGCPVEKMARGATGYEFNLGRVFAWRLTRTVDGGDTVKEKRDQAALHKAELELAVLRGDVVNREDAIQSMAGSVSAFRNRMRALSRKVAPLIAPRERMTEVEGILRRHIDEALSEIASNEFAETIHRGLAAGVPGGAAAAGADRKPVGRRRAQAVERSVG
jgi:phage terminase Nu1 subunit (DNA packaging protein)